MTPRDTGHATKTSRLSEGMPPAAATREREARLPRHTSERVVMQPMGSGDRGVSSKAEGGQQVSVPCLRLVAAGVDERGRLVETKRAFAGSAADLKGLLEFLCTDAAHTTRAHDMGRYVKQQAKKRKKTGRSSSMEYDSLAESQRSQTMELRKRDTKK